MGNCELWKYKWNEDVIIAVVSQSKQAQNYPPPPPPRKKKTTNKISGFQGIHTRGLCVRAAVLYHLSYEDPYIGKQAFQAMKE